MQSKTYYDILEISSDATAREIKKAYFKKVRQNSPDKEPEKFKKIRAAYEVLSDEVAKREYDQRVDLPKWITGYLDLARRHRGMGDPRRAIEMYEEILDRYKRIRFIEVELGEAYIENSNSQKAIDLFSKLLEENQDDVFIMKRLINSYSERGWINKAIKLCEYMIDKELEDIQIVYAMMLDAYINKRKAKEAQEIAIKLLDYDNIEKIDLYGIITTTELSIIEEQSRKTYKTYKKLKKYCILFVNYLNENKEMIERAMEDLIFAVFSAYEAEEAFKLIDPLIEHVEDKEILEEYAFIRKEKLLEDSFSRFEEDGRIPMELKALIGVSLADERYDIDETDVIGAKIEVIANYDEFKSKIKIIKSEYEVFYDLIKNFLEEIRFERNRVKLLKKFEQILMNSEYYDSDFDPSFIEVETYVSDEVKVGRNDPCPCGSGKKYKKCCINK